MYSTEPLIEYDSDKDPAVYKYDNFGCFTLMDDEWIAVEDFIEFDTEKTLWRA